MVEVKKKRKKNMVLDVLSKDATCSTQVVKAAADKDKKKKRKKGINGDALPKISRRSFSPAVAIDVTNKHKKHMKYKKGELDGGDNDGVRLIKEKKHSIINTRDDCRDGTEFSRVTHDLNKCKKMEKEKKKKKKKKKKKGEEEIIADDDCNPDVIHLPNEMNNKKRKKKCDAVDKGNCLSSLDEKKSKKKKRKGQINVQVDGTLSLDDFEISNNEKKRKKTKSTKRKLANNETIDYETTDKIENSIPEKKRKRVRFSSDVEMFPSENIPKKLRKEIQYTGTQIRGKRFTPEEDNLLKEAVYKYIEDHELGDVGLEMVLNASKYPKIRGCWNVIALTIPWRPTDAIYNRTKIIFSSNGIRHKWTPEEIDLVKRHAEVNGHKWAGLALSLGIHRRHVKEAWRRNRLPNLKKGPWSQDELQQLFDLVNLDYRMSFAEKKDSKHGMLRDNISWEAISNKIGTRLHKDCCLKWYMYLSSSMVIRGSWADCDDYLLVDALQKLEACCAEDVDWDSLLEHRSGDICRTRWEEMTKYIGGHQEKSFMDQVDVLSNRYCPEMYEYRVKRDEDEDDENYEDNEHENIEGGS